MKYLEGQDRLQQEIQTRCLDETVERGAEVRVIDAFVGALDMAKMGFRIDNGRPAYHPADMLRRWRSAAACQHHPGGYPTLAGGLNPTLQFKVI
jgi:hypothetical protein